MPPRPPESVTAAALVLEDGRRFAGYRFGAPVDAAGEVVFHTAMTGYQEILSDPSYSGQMVVMTYPLIGNYGIAPADHESARSHATALIVKEASRRISNWRGTRTLDEHLRDTGVAGLAGIDTRALVRHLRSRGAMRGVVVDAEHPAEDARDLAGRVPSMVGQDIARFVSTTERTAWTQGSPSLAGFAREEVDDPPAFFRVVVVDYGLKWSIARRLVDARCAPLIVPADTSAADILALAPDGVVLSNGPGDPEPVTYGVETVRALLGRVPLLGICLGHQILGLALGARTYKLRFGHHGGNHPVRETDTGRVWITSHNHGFAVDADSLPMDRVDVTHVDLTDGTLEGLRVRDARAFSVQFHPEAAPGPSDAASVFESFTTLMRGPSRAPTT